MEIPHNMVWSTSTQKSDTCVPDCFSSRQRHWTTGQAFTAHAATHRTAPAMTLLLAFFAQAKSPSDTWHCTVNATRTQGEAFEPASKGMNTTNVHTIKCTLNSSGSLSTWACRHTAQTGKRDITAIFVRQCWMVLITWYNLAACHSSYMHLHRE